MSIESKHAYRFGFLKSDAWEIARLHRLVTDHACCQICGEESVSNDVHHIYYPVRLKESNDSCLVTLCRACHDLIHRLMLKHYKEGEKEIAFEDFKTVLTAVKLWMVKKLPNLRVKNDQLVLVKKERNPYWEPPIMACLGCKRYGLHLVKYSVLKRYERPGPQFSLCPDCIKLVEDWPCPPPTAALALRRLRHWIRKKAPLYDNTVCSTTETTSGTPPTEGNCVVTRSLHQDVPELGAGDK